MRAGLGKIGKEYLPNVGDLLYSATCYTSIIFSFFIFSYSFLVTNLVPFHVCRKHRLLVQMLTIGCR